MDNKSHLSVQLFDNMPEKKINTKNNPFLSVLMYFVLRLTPRIMNYNIQQIKRNNALTLLRHALPWNARERFLGPGEQPAGIAEVFCVGGSSAK